MSSVPRDASREAGADGAKADAGARFSSYVGQWRDAIDAALLGGIALVAREDLRDYYHRPLMEFLARGGKRTRPALVLLGCEVCGGNPTLALGAAAAVEHFQVAALIHDDIADHAITRRGASAVHVLEGEGLAITIGDGALVESFLDILGSRGLSANLQLALVNELSEMMMRTVEGQALDVGWARDARFDLSPSDYLEMATLKTAHYSVATPLVMGALVAGASEERVEALREAGLALGLAFQIADDLLDLEGTADVLGKEPLGDIAEGKRTLAVTYALEGLNEEMKSELALILDAEGASRGEILRAASLIREGGGVERARAKARELAEDAAHVLDHLELGEGEAALALRSLPHYVLERTH